MENNIWRRGCWPRRRCFVIAFGILASAIFAQGNANRSWSVRKTGEFGRRLSAGSLAQELELPSKQFRIHEPSFGESRLSPAFSSVRKPSQDLELPRLLTPSVGTDQEAQETAEGDGYAYAKPEDNEGYNYPSPVAGPSPVDDEVAEKPKAESPEPQEPEFVAGPGDAVLRPFIKQSEMDIDADSLEPKKPPSLSPQVAAEHGSDCHGDENDPNCWPHGYAGAITGEAGTDYPVLAEIVPTSFSCDEQEYSGYYADTDEVARCQIFHVCLKGTNHRRTRQWSFLCPNGTLFSQSDFVCVWWTEAPECNAGTVRSLYSLNEQLGWDNVTEGNGGGARGGGGRVSNLELQSAMSALSPASRNTPFPQPTTFRPATYNTKGPSTTSGGRTALPYRVPVKVNGGQGRARTKLQEVTQNALHGSAHELDYGDDTLHEEGESTQFETSLRHQSESRTKSKTASALHRSTSEAYELKGSPNAIQPNVVNAPTPSPPHGGYDDHHQVVMMPTLQRYPDGSEGYAEVPVMLPHHSEEPQEGYQYPVPQQAFPPQEDPTPAPTYLPPFRSAKQKAVERITTTTENYPTPTIPTEPSLDGENFEVDYSTTTTEQPSTTTEFGGYVYTNPTTTEATSTGYRYPTPTTTEQVTGQRSGGYQYTKPPPTETTEVTAGTTEDGGGYVYTSPTTTTRGTTRYQSTITTEQTSTAYTTEQTTTEAQGYQYKAPENAQLKDGYTYTTPTTTTQPSTTVTEGTSVVTEDDYHLDTTLDTTRTGYPESTTLTTPERSQKTSVTDVPAGGYLPPQNENEVQGKQAGDEDTVDIPAEDYEDEENEVTDTTGGGEEGGYGGGGYQLSTPSSTTPEVVLNGGSLDSEDKINEILRQIQAGGIEAVDAAGKPIGFAQLKELLLKSPKGSVELKGAGLDSVTSSSVAKTEEVVVEPPRSQGVATETRGGTQEHQYYHTVSTATVVPRNNDIIYSSNGQQQQQSSRFPPSPSGFYLPPDNGGNRGGNQFFQPQRPDFEIKVPSREFESHFVDSNNLEGNNNAFLSNQQQRQQSQPPRAQSQEQVQYTDVNINLPSPQQQFFQQPTYTQDPLPSLATGVVPPTGEYLPPQQTYQHEPINDNQQQSQYISQNPAPPPLQPERQYLPPQRPTSSLLQPQYFADASIQQVQQTSQFVSPPIQLTENIQLQQSYAQPLPTSAPTGRNAGGSRNPLANPKEIKIVPAVLVHGHTSVASQAEPNTIQQTRIDNHGGGGFNLDTAQSIYQPRHFARNSLAEQLNQIANTAHHNGGGFGGRQFTRRSNNHNNNSRTEKTPPVSAFTLEDARTTEELQQYHHQDLRRFHSENIAKNDNNNQRPTSRTSTEHNLPALPRQSVTSTTTSRQSRHRHDDDNDSRGKSSSTTSPSRFSLNLSTTSTSRRNEEYFIPISTSFGTGGSRGGDSRGGSREEKSGDGRRSYLVDAESESTLLNRFLPEEEGGFGARL